LFVLIGIVVLLVLLSFFNKGPKTVYLKPKNNNLDTASNPDSNDATKNGTNNTANGTNNTARFTKTNIIDTETTKAYEDDSVIQSDLKTIKQSAVKMSVGQKQEASQILKDWLDDGKSDDTANNGTDEESN
jgi:hypothetical protein